jgi:signal transduction histidine kinase
MTKKIDSAKNAPDRSQPKSIASHIFLNNLRMLVFGGVLFFALFVFSCYAFDKVNTLSIIVSLFPQLVFFYLLMISAILWYTKADNEKILEPIKEMTEAVNRLTMMNIHSERLNEDGMTDELNTLAAMINEMLDRMDVSYETQKRFVSDASHELRTPIAVFKGYSQMLDRWGASDPEVLRESIDSLLAESEMMQDLVEKLLFLSRYDKRTLKLHKEYFNMRIEMEDILRETKLTATDRLIEHTIMQDCNVYGDKQSLKQAVRVLVDNAVKYSRPGDKVTVSCRNNNQDCIIGIEDTGVGMKASDVDNIFNRFYRADDARNLKVEGHGLGLSIAKMIFSEHTAKINIRTQYGVGTRFFVTIPRRRT